MIKSSFLNVPFILLCLTGFSYQIIQISIEYFSFKTSTKTVLQLDHKFIIPSMIFCIRYTDIIDRTNYQKYGIYPKYNYNSTEMFHDMSKLTIKDIFDLTPDPSEIIIGCEHRDIDHLELTTREYSRSHCNSLFPVTKYLEGAFICYQFRTKIPKTSFNCYRALLSFYPSNELYLISLHQQLLFSNAIKLISFVPNGINSSLVSIPDISRRFYALGIRYAHALPNSSKENLFKIFGDFHSIARLEKPYDTQCTWNENEAEEACRRRCIIPVFGKYGYFPSTEYAIKPQSLKHLEPLGNVNKTILQDIKARTTNCYRSCNKKRCHDWYSVTGFESFAFLLNNSISIASGCSKRPAVIIQYLPRITFMEFVTYISSSLGIWFGISVLAINPFKGNKKPCPKTTKKRFDIRFLRQARRDSTISLQILVQDLDRRLREIENR